MQTDLGIIVVILIIFASCVIMSRQIIHGAIWKKLIEHNMLREDMHLSELSSFDSHSWMKWGIVIIALSISIIFVQILPVSVSEEMKIGIAGIFVGAAFIIAYVMSNHVTRNQ